MRIVYFDIDSCRPDHLGCYGYARPTSPVIDGLAGEGLVATACHTSDAPCLPSRAALFSARLGIHNGINCHEGPASQLRYAGRGHLHDPDRPMWMRHLQQRGWQTVCFSGFAQRHLAWWFTAGFTQFFGNQLPGGSESADEVNEKVLPWLRREGAADNWFLHVNYWDVHTPYQAPQRYRARVRDGAPPAHPTAGEIAEDAHHYYGPRTARDWWADRGFHNARNDAYGRQMPESGPETWESYLGFLEGYDAGIAYVDEKIGEILEELERLGVREETAIIVGADHGESIGELGMYFEHGNGCEGTSRVPLVVHWPGLAGAGRRFDGLAYQLDLPPTVLELLGMEVPSGWDGRSFAGALRGDAGGRDHLVLSSGIYSYQRAVRTPRHRLIRTIHPGLYPYDESYLFDMEEDPGERRNLVSERPEVLAELDHLLVEWTYGNTTGAAAVSDPFQEQLAAGIDPDLYCPRDVIEGRLRDLGRDDQLADLHRRRDPAPAPRPW